MSTYKEVFQLAQDKGYRLRKARTISDDGIIDVNTYLWGDEEEVKNHIRLRLEEIKEDSLIELTLIQKWLREENKIGVFVQRATYGHYGEVIYKDITRDSKPIISNLGFSRMTHSYDTALCDGIYEALKLLK